MSSVNIGISPDYSIPMTEENMHRSKTISFVILIVLGILIVVMLLWIGYVISQPRTSEPELIVGNGSGLTTKETCEASNGRWIINRCYCKAGFSGKTCTEVPNLKGLGDVTKDEISGDIIHESQEESLVKCSRQCDSQCSGLLFENNLCTLYSGEITSNKGLSKSNNSTLFVKKVENVKYTKNRIILAESDMSYKNGTYITILPETVVELNFIPKIVIKEPIYRGLYSPIRFNFNSVRELVDDLNNTNQYYLDDGNELKIPADWVYRLPIYVIYF